MPLTLRSVLVATDLTERTDPVLRAASALAAVAGAEIHAIHAFELQPLPYGEADAAPSFQRRIARAEEELEAQVQRALPPTAALASRKIEIYLAHKAILDRAEQVHADVVVLGPHRSDRIADRFLGSTADRVVRTSAVPILIVRDGFDLPLRTVLAPTDFSEPGRRAVEHAADWAAALGPAELRVLHVIPWPTELLVPGAAFDGDHVADALEREVGRARERAGPGSGLTALPETRRSERPAEEIVRAARDDGAGLLVIGTHGHGAIERVLIGSVASSVARSAPCPVLLVPPAAAQDGRYGRASSASSGR